MKNFLLSYSALVILFCVFKAECSGVISAYYSLYKNMHGRSLEFGKTLDNNIMISTDITLIAEKGDIYLKEMDPLGGGFNFAYTINAAEHFQFLPIGVSAGYWRYNFGGIEGIARSGNNWEEGVWRENSSILFSGFFTRMRIGGKKVWFDISDRILFGRTKYEREHTNYEGGYSVTSYRQRNDFIAINNVYAGITWTPSRADKKLVIKKELADEIASVKITADSAIATAKEVKKALTEIERMQQKIIHEQIRINIALNAVSPTRLEESEIQLAYLTEAFHDLYSRVKSIQILPIIQNAQKPLTRPPGFTVSTAPLVFGGEEYALYSRALDSYRKRFYEESRQIMRELISAFPEGKYSDRAYFWMGESHFQEKDYPQAIVLYGKVFDFVESSKEDDAQYKIALCYKLLGEQDKAFEEFTKLAQRYPASEFVPLANNEIKEILIQRNNKILGIEETKPLDLTPTVEQSTFEPEPAASEPTEPTEPTEQSEQTETPSEQDEAPSQQITIKQPTADKDYEKRQKSIVKYTNDLEKMEKALAEIKQSAPATYEVANFSVELLKTLNRTQEKGTFDLNEILPFILKATLMTLPPNTISPSAQINPDIAVKLFPFLTVDFNLPSNRAINAINSALKSWNGKSVYDIKDEMARVPPAQKVKIAMLLKNSTGVFAATIPQLNVTIKASL